MKDQTFQQVVIRELRVEPTVDIAHEAWRREDFLAGYLRKAGAAGYVLGVSGGVDSTTAAKLMVDACNAARSTGHACQSIVVRLPYGEQADEVDAQCALEWIGADVVETVDIKPAVDAMMASIDLSGLSKERVDFIKGNVKARVRMVVQYAIAARYNALVVGTDHASEACMGFFTKGGDGFADVMPLAGLTKDQVRELAAFLEAPDHLVTKAPTADLEDLRPGLLDEEAFGFPYEHVNTYLKGGEIPPESEDKLVAAFVATAHKRRLPATPEPLNAWKYMD